MEKKTYEQIRVRRETYEILRKFAYIERRKYINVVEDAVILYKKMNNKK